jgi:hypothetical protein
MGPRDFTARVSARGAVVVGVAALVSGWLGGASAAAGLLAGGAIALLDFRWIARSLAAPGAGARLTAGHLVASAGRLLAAFGALGLVLASGWVHPVALMAGLALVPAVLIAHGLRAAREMT